MKGILGLVLALAAAPLSAGNLPAGERPPILRDVGWDQKLGESVPGGVALRDEAGREVHLGDYFGKRPVVFSLVYYECPMLCTLTLNGLGSALSVLAFDPGKEFEIVTVSFNPADTPELAAAKKQVYLRRYHREGAEAHWHFLTGEAAAISRITQAVGFRYAWDAETRQFAHPAGVLVLTPEGKIARYLYGVEYAPRDLRLAIVEASAGKVGSPVDQVLLFCYHYDPSAGKYSAAVLDILRVAAGATLLALGGFVWLMLRRERTHGVGAPAAHGGAG